MVPEEHAPWLIYTHLVQELDLGAEVSAIFLCTFEMPLPAA